MIGNFYPFTIATTVNAINFVGTPVNVRSTNAATEVANDTEWLMANS